MSNPKTDYSNTIIYKIYCKDERIQDVYVGHTTNFVKRKKSHMSSCMKSNYPNHNCKLYQVIRKNGGWDNWQMMIIAFYECKDLNEARQKEQYHYVDLKATLNSVEPMSSAGIHPKNNQSKNDDEVHITYNKPTIRNGLTTYTCEPCRYHTTFKRDYDRHLLTQKHIDGGNIGKTPIKTQNGYSCPICHNTYKSRTSTYTHINKCVVPITLHTTNTNTNTNTNTIPTISESNSFVTNQNYITEVITHNQELRASNQELRTAMLLLIQQNTDFQNKMLDICKKCSHS
jgi:GIY-YIG catalytic domain